MKNNELIITESETILSNLNLEDFNNTPKEAFLFFPEGYDLFIEENNIIHRKIFEDIHTYLPHEAYWLNELNNYIDNNSIVLDINISEGDKLRFLNSCEYDYKEAAEKLIEHSVFLKKYNFHTFKKFSLNLDKKSKNYNIYFKSKLIESSLINKNKETNTKDLIINNIKSKTSKTFSFSLQNSIKYINKEVFDFLNNGCIYIHGRDSCYRPLVVVNLAKFLDLNFELSFDSIKSSIIYLNNYIISNLLIPGQVETWNIILNLNKVSLLSIPTKIKELISIMQSNYKIRINKIFVFKLTFSLHIIKSLVYTLYPSCKNKIIYVNDNNYKDVIFNSINPSQLEEKFYGIQDNIDCFFDKYYDNKYMYSVLNIFPLLKLKNNKIIKSFKVDSSLSFLNNNIKYCINNNNKISFSQQLSIKDYVQKVKENRVSVPNLKIVDEFIINNINNYNKYYTCDNSFFIEYEREKYNFLRNTTSKKYYIELFILIKDKIKSTNKYAVNKYYKSYNFQNNLVNCKYKSISSRYNDYLIKKEKLSNNLKCSNFIKYNDIKSTSKNNKTLCECKISIYMLN